MSSLAFYLVALVVVSAAIYAVSSPKLLNAALSLALSFFAVGGLYFLLGAPFLGVLQVLINAGAIPIVTVFIIMMTQSRVTLMKPITVAYWAAAAFVLVIAAGLYTPQIRGFTARGGALTDVNNASSKDIGLMLLSSTTTNGRPGTLLAFEVASVILLVAMVGAIILARREGETIKGTVNVLPEVGTPVAAGVARGRAPVQPVTHGDEEVGD